jgi:hypothetical protein
MEGRGGGEAQGGAEKKVFPDAYACVVYLNGNFCKLLPEKSALSVDHVCPREVSPNERGSWQMSYGDGSTSNPP